MTTNTSLCDEAKNVDAEPGCFALFLGARLRSKPPGSHVFKHGLLPTTPRYMEASAGDCAKMCTERREREREREGKKKDTRSDGWWENSRDQYNAGVRSINYLPECSRYVKRSSCQTRIFHTVWHTWPCARGAATDLGWSSKQTGSEAPANHS